MEDTRLSSLFGKDLAGWQVSFCHVLELDHQLFTGPHPAVTIKKEPIVTQQKVLLRTIWSVLDRRHAKVTSFLALINEETRLGFHLTNGAGGDTRAFRLFTAADIEDLCAQEGSVQWPHGIVDLSNKPVPDPVFV